MITLMTNEEYITKYIENRGLNKHNTYNSVKLIMNHYSAFQKLSIHELILEADTEEEAGIRWKRRTVKKRLINYTQLLFLVCRYIQGFSCECSSTYFSIYSVRICFIVFFSCSATILNFVFNSLSRYIVIDSDVIFIISLIIYLFFAVYID